MPYRFPESIVPSSVSESSSDATNTVPSGENLENVGRQVTQGGEVFESNGPSPALSAASNQHRQKSQDRRSDPQGLTVLYSPADFRTADIVFIHGLGGSSRQTWSKNKNPDLCWPQRWLPKEAEMSSARILTFGYNAHFSTPGPNSASSIADFAKALLFDMKFGKDNEARDLSIGDVSLMGLESALCT